MFWSCDIINNWDIDVIKSTQPLVTRALNEALRYPCLWLRGIMPHNLTSVPHNKNNLIFVYDYKYDLDIPPKGQWGSGLYFGDGSGGPHGSYSMLRRCGVGLAHMIGNIYMGGLHFKLPGDVQTVPRAEVSACHALVAHLDCNTKV